MEGCPVSGIRNVGPLSKYGSLLLLITDDGVTREMPVAISLHGLRWGAATDLLALTAGGWHTRRRRLG